MILINPYLKFTGNCREAMNFYKEILDWELSMVTVGESFAGDQMPASKDSIMQRYLVK